MMISSRIHFIPLLYLLSTFLNAVASLHYKDKYISVQTSRQLDNRKRFRYAVTFLYSGEFKLYFVRPASAGRMMECAHGTVKIIGRGQVISPQSEKQRVMDYRMEVAGIDAPGVRYTAYQFLRVSEGTRLKLSGMLPNFYGYQYLNEPVVPFTWSSDEEAVGIPVEPPYTRGSESSDQDSNSPVQGRGHAEMPWNPAVASTSEHSDQHPDTILMFGNHHPDTTLRLGWG